MLKGFKDLCEFLGFIIIPFIILYIGIIEYVLPVYRKLAIILGN